MAVLDRILKFFEVAVKEYWAFMSAHQIMGTFLTVWLISIVLKFFQERRLTSRPQTPRPPVRPVVPATPAAPAVDSKVPSRIERLLEDDD